MIKCPAHIDRIVYNINDIHLSKGREHLFIVRSLLIDHQEYDNQDMWVYHLRIDMYVEIQIVSEINNIKFIFRV